MAHYLQVRLLHDMYDFSTASVFTRQKENKVLAVINFGTNGGDKHISIDRIRDGKFKAKDLRLRFEFGSCKDLDVSLPVRENVAFTAEASGCKTAIRLLEARFDHLKGYWEKGGDGENSWVDYVIYSGNEKDFDLTQVAQAIYAFALSFGNQSDELSVDGADAVISDNVLNASWGICLFRLR